MEIKIINPSTLPVPSGYNHGLLVSKGRLLFLAGQDASDAQGQIVAPGDLLGQFEQVLINLKAVVEEAGGSPQHIVKLNIFVYDRNNYLANLKPLGRLYRSYFGDHYPAMALFQVSGFFRQEALIEIEGMAVLPEGQEPG
ncbi:RidA family protein [Acidobacteria bacterium AH-259-D05]|nr:RidA family protein [Acidobacteria bacterium AH-259-D05]